MKSLCRMHLFRRRRRPIVLAIAMLVCLALLCRRICFKQDWTKIQERLRVLKSRYFTAYSRASDQATKATPSRGALLQTIQRLRTEGTLLTAADKAHLHIEQSRFDEQLSFTAAMAWQPDHDHVHKGSPQVTFEQYIRLNNIKIEPLSSIEFYSLPLLHERDAVVQCELAGERCKAVLKQTFNNTDSFTLQSTFPLLSSGNSTFYVKPEFISYIEYLDTEVKCAVLPPTELKVMVESPGTEGCQLPDIDPFSKSSMIFFLTQAPMACEGTLFTRCQNGLLEVVTNHDRGAPLKNISFQTIHRNNGSDYGFKLGESKPLKYKGQPVHVGTDFIQVNAEFTNGMIQTDFHAQVRPKLDVLKRTARYKPGIPLNIAILALDQTSHATFQRLLPEAYNFLRDDLQAFMFDGFSLVGQATTPQLTALLTGKTVDDNCEKHEARRGFEGAGTVDNWPFIFKTLKKYGYVTMFSEDAPPIGAFNMRLNGFRKPPCDHYARPFWSAVPHTLLGGLHENCINSQPQHMLQLEYLKSLFMAYPKKRKFGFSFLSSLCHQETIMPLSAAANNMYKFFNSIRDSGYLNDTMLVVMGDHGARTGEFRATLQGRLEERLPFLSVILPKFFHEKFPEFVDNLKLNTQVITTPLDLHATFLHLLTYPENPSESDLTRGTSLFSKIPRNRTCQEANIPEYFCPCVYWVPLNVTHAHVIISAHRAAEHINTLLRKDARVSRLCAKLKVDKILDGWEETPNAKVQTFSGIHNGDGLGVGTADFNSPLSQSGCSYQVRFRTIPGYGIFEAWVQLVNGKFIVNEPISRINIYGSHPDCIKSSHPYLRQFCYCNHDS